MTVSRRSPAVNVAVAVEAASPLAAEEIASAVRAALARSEYDRAEVSVAVVDDATIRRLNRQFLDHDYETDVLSFVLDDGPAGLEGEIVVSAETAVRGAAEAGWEARDELMLYVLHGALHLIGYRDKSPADAALMRQEEASLLVELGVRPAASDARWQGSPSDASAFPQEL